MLSVDQRDWHGWMSLTVGYNHLSHVGGNVQVHYGLCIFTMINLVQCPNLWLFLRYLCTEMLLLLRQRDSNIRWRISGLKILKMQYNATFRFGAEIMNIIITSIGWQDLVYRTVTVNQTSCKIIRERESDKQLRSDWTVEVVDNQCCDACVATCWVLPDYSLSVV